MLSVLQIESIVVGTKIIVLVIRTAWSNNLELPAIELTQPRFIDDISYEVEQNILPIQYFLINFVFKIRNQNLPYGQNWEYRLLFNLEWTLILYSVNFKNNFFFTKFYTDY